MFRVAWQYSVFFCIILYHFLVFNVVFVCLWRGNDAI